MYECNSRMYHVSVFYSCILDVCGSMQDSAACYTVRCWHVFIHDMYGYSILHAVWIFDSVDMSLRIDACLDGCMDVCL